MGGFGSGRTGGLLSGRGGGRPTIEGCGSIVLAIGEVTSMRKGKDTFGVIHRGQVGHSAYSIQIVVEFGPEGKGKMTIQHDAFDHLSEPVPAASYFIELLAEPWQFGGHRWFMICPQSGRRVFKLYLPNGAHRFASRKSLGLAYRVQRLDPIQKGHARLARVFGKLGAHYHNLNQAMPTRPKGMRLKTYSRLVADIGVATRRHCETYPDRLRDRLRLMIAAEERGFAAASNRGRPDIDHTRRV